MDYTANDARSLELLVLEGRMQLAVGPARLRNAGKEKKI